MTNWTVDVGDKGMRLDAWLAARPEIGSRGKAREAIACGKVYLNKAEATFEEAGRRLTGGDQVGFWPDRPGSSRPRRRDIVSARRELAVVYEDEAIVVVNKPPGWLVEPLPGEEAGEATLRDLLDDHLRHRRGLRPLVVHRIDRDTSGLVLFALTRAARDVLKAQFERRAPERTYLAILNGRPIPPRGTWRDRLVWDKERLVQKRAHAEEERARDAEARYQVVEQFDFQALVEVSLRTGKRNQIRVQAGSRGHALVGERQYRFGRPRDEAHEPEFGRQALHAARLAFTHPVTHRRVEFTAALPDDLKRLLQMLRGAHAGQPQRTQRTQRLPR
jgi:23S rRNA pseudouridine1911/1915/1917 synthase